MQIRAQDNSVLAMALFPRKYRSLCYKLVVIVPVLWLTVMLIAHNSNSGSSNLVPSGPGSDGLNPNDIQSIEVLKDASVFES